MRGWSGGASFTTRSDVWHVTRRSTRGLPPTSRVPLGALAKKTTIPALARFLEDPLRAHPGGGCQGWRSRPRRRATSLGICCVTSGSRRRRAGRRLRRPSPPASSTRSTAGCGRRFPTLRSSRRRRPGRSSASSSPRKGRRMDSGSSIAGSSISRRRAHSHFCWHPTTARASSSTERWWPISTGSTPRRRSASSWSSRRGATRSKPNISSATAARSWSSSYGGRRGRGGGPGQLFFTRGPCIPIIGEAVRRRRRESRRGGEALRGAALRLVPRGAWARGAPAAKPFAALGSGGCLRGCARRRASQLSSRGAGAGRARGGRGRPRPMDRRARSQRNDGARPRALSLRFVPRARRSRAARRRRASPGSRPSARPSSATRGGSHRPSPASARSSRKIGFARCSSRTARRAPTWRPGCHNSARRTSARSPSGSGGPTSPRSRRRRPQRSRSPSRRRALAHRGGLVLLHHLPQVRRARLARHPSPRSRDQLCAASPRVVPPLYVGSGLAPTRHSDATILRRRQGPDRWGPRRRRGAPGRRPLELFFVGELGAAAEGARRRLRARDRSQRSAGRLPELRHGGGGAGGGGGIPGADLLRLRRAEPTFGEMLAWALPLGRARLERARGALRRSARDRSAGSSGGTELGRPRRGKRRRRFPTKREPPRAALARLPPRRARGFPPFSIRSARSTWRRPSARDRARAGPIFARSLVFRSPRASDTWHSAPTDRGPAARRGSCRSRSSRRAAAAAPFTATAEVELAW